MTLLSRLVAPIRIKTAFNPGWWLQPGQKGASRVSLKERHLIQRHMYSVSGVVRSHARDETYWIRVLSRTEYFFLPCTWSLVPVIGPGTKGSGPLVPDC